MRVLLASPSRDLNSSIGKLLEKDGCKVETAFDGAGLSGLIAGGKFDAAIADRRLPRLNENRLISLCRDLRIPIILLKDRAVRLNDLVLDPPPSEYLVFPFEYSKLKKLLNEIIGFTSFGEEIALSKTKVDLGRLKLPGGAYLTYGEALALKALTRAGDGGVQIGGLYASALNQKLASSGCGLRTEYKAGKGYCLVAET